MTGAQEPENVSTQRQRIATLARTHPARAFSSLAHHIDLSWLHEAYRRTRKDGAVGVDGKSAAAYAADLEANLRALLERAKSGDDRAPPVRRVHIPKGDGTSTRPIGIPTFEDKVLQRAVAMVLEPLYEQDFHPDSYGFRPGRSAHQALAALRRRLTEMGGGWVLELDIRSYFDSIDHALLRELLQQRVKDGVLTRLIGKWLKAGVMEDGRWQRPEAGSPQGGVISPLLANIYLHHVLDAWFDREVRPRLIGRSSMLRYADDAVLLFANERDARRVLTVLSKRFERYGLTLHPTKTRLVRFVPPRQGGGEDGGSFDLLGFTHFWAKSRKGRWTIQRRTAKDRFRRALKRIALWCRRNRHRPIREQHTQLWRKLKGHYAYYGLSGNDRALNRLRFCVERVGVKWLSRRSQRGWLNWLKASRLLARLPLPQPRIVHRAVA
jgi:RNA-directed DNA polymerase